MNHNINLNLVHKNIINFSILCLKTNCIFRICKIEQNKKNANKINQIQPTKSNNKDIISEDFFKRYHGVIKNLAMQKCDNFSLNRNKINSQKEKLTSIINKDIKKENESLDHKKKLRKINKKVNSKEKKLNSLVKPILFEEKPVFNKNISKKDEIKTNKFENLFNFKNNKNFIFNKFNSDVDKLINKKINNLSFNNYSSKNSFPLIPNINFIQNTKSFNNISFNLDYFNKSYQKFDTKFIIPNIPNYSFQNSFNLSTSFLNPNPFNKFNNNTFNNKFDFNDNNKLNISKQCTDSSLSFINQEKNQTSAQMGPKKLIIKYINTRKGRKAKNSKTLLTESKHTKFSEDNMMRKIKNKIVESSRLLVNKVFKDEINTIKNKTSYMRQEFSKIKGAFSQELNIKYNLFFYQMKIKDIFSLELSNKYTAIEKNFNKELIDYIFSEENKNYFNKTKILLEMSFHQFFHDIFLGEVQSWKSYFGINLMDNKYQIDNILINLENVEDTVENNQKYIRQINALAHNYENFFLSKKTRKVDIGHKKEDWIKSFMNNITKEQYEYYLEQIKQCKNYYDQRNKSNEIQNNNTTNNKNIIPIKNTCEKPIFKVNEVNECINDNSTLSNNNFNASKENNNNLNTLIFSEEKGKEKKLNNHKKNIFCCRKRKPDNFEFNSFKVL